MTVHTTPVSSPPLAFRDAGYKAFRVAPPTKRGVALRNVLHLGRSDPEGTKKALRTLADDRELERAFRRAGDFEFKRCCDWRRPDATANVMAAISTADVIVATGVEPFDDPRRRGRDVARVASSRTIRDVARVASSRTICSVVAASSRRRRGVVAASPAIPHVGQTQVAMHGAALTHLIWAKPDAVVVELFAHRMSGLWYYEKYGDRADQSREIPSQPSPPPRNIHVGVAASPRPVSA